MTPAQQIAADWAAGERDLYAALAWAVAASAPADAAAAEAMADRLAAGVDGEAGEILRGADPGLLRAIARHVGGFPAVPGADLLPGLLTAVGIEPVFPALPGARTLVLPSDAPGRPAFSDPAFDRWFAGTGAAFGLGLYGEDRGIRDGLQFADPASPEARTLHLGVDIFTPAGTTVHAPLPGTVDSVACNAEPQDYGHTLILRHDLDGTAFFTVYGLLAADLPALCRPGQEVVAGQPVGRVGNRVENGGWAPHLHLQIALDLLGQAGTGNFYGAGHPGLWPVWRQISPDANLLLRLPEERFRG